MIVIDASVALKWVLDEPGFEAARALQTESLLAPRFWLLECANALWRIARRGDFTTEVALDKFNILSAAPVAVEDRDGDVGRALEIANILNHQAYDCLYLALAIREGVQMITADARFFRAASAVPDLSRSVRLLDDTASVGA